MSSTLTITVSGTPIAFIQDSLKISQKINTRTSCTFTILDTLGTAVYVKGQPVVVSDSVLGVLFSGFVNKPVAINLYPNPHRLLTIDCLDQVWLADKRVSNTIYNNQQAAVIVCDQTQTILSQEGVTGAYALDYNHYETDWAAGGASLSGVVATANTGDGNVGDGDLELSPAGTLLSYTDNFSAGTLTNVVDSSGTLELASTQGLQLLGTAVQGNSNPYIYYQIWTGSVSLASGDKLVYDVWTADTCPAQEAGADLGFTDGATLKDYTPTIVDQNGIGAHPSNDLSGFATDQWYTRTFDLTPMYNAGHTTIAFTSVALEGNSNGSYAAYFRHIKLVNSSGGLKQTFFESSLQSNQIIGLAAYINYSLLQCTVYEMSGTRVAPSISLTSMSIPKTSLIDWVAPAIASSLTPTVPSTNKTLPTVDIQTSIDNGATWQSCANYAAIPNILAGMSMSGRSLQLQQVFTMAGPDPTLTPTLTGVSLSIQPSYAATKADVIQSESTTAEWNAGTLSHLLAANNQLLLNESSRSWMQVSDLSDQTLYGVTSGNPGQTTQNGLLELFCNGSNDDARSRLDFAGQWNNFIAEVDINLGNPVVALAYGLEYRTGTWSDTFNSFGWYAYFIFTSSGGAGTLNLAYASGGSLNIIATQAITLSSGSQHRIKLIVNGSSHKLYMDGLLQISITDTTYQSVTSYIACHFFNNSGAAHSGDFSNFGVCESLTGTWQSVTQSLAGATTYGNSLIAWEEVNDPVQTTSLVIQTSIDGGSTYQVCTNGGTIPNLVAGQSLSGVNLIIQALFTSPSANLTPILEGLTAWVIGQFNASGIWISPALALTNVGRLGASLCNWNATLPNADTTLVVKTSVDGGSTYQTIAAAGDAIPNLTDTPTPWQDFFPVNTSADYTQGHLNAGGLAAWAWNANYLQATQTSGIDGVLEYLGLSSADMAVSGDFNFSDSGGLVARMIDTSHCYFVSVADASAATNTNTARLYSFVSGTKTLIGRAAISFTRNTFRRFILDCQGTAIKVYMDGVLIISATDSTITAAGTAAILSGIHTGNQIQCYGFRVAPYGQQTSSVSVLTKLILASTDPLNTPQVLDTATWCGGVSIGPGALIPSVAYQQTYVSQNIDDLNRQSAYWWTIASNAPTVKQLLFQPEQAVPAPFIAAQDNQTVVLAGQTLGDILVEGLQVEYSGDLYRNQMVLKNVQATQTFVQKFVGDGTATSWTLNYPVAPGTIPFLTLNGATGLLLSIGIKGQDTGKQYYYTPGGTAIDQDPSQSVLTGLQTLEVAYSGTFTTDVTRNNTGGFPGTVSQSQYAAIDGTSGIVTVVVDMSSSPTTATMDVAAAEAYGDSLLAQYGIVGRIVTLKSYRQGLLPGQQLSVFLAIHTIVNAQTLITQVDTEVQAGTGGYPLYKYTVIATEGSALSDWQKVFASVFAGAA